MKTYGETYIRKAEIAQLILLHQLYMQKESRHVIFHTVIVVQTPAEILSDKVRALLEMPYLKGRDFFDLWYLYSVIETPVEARIIESKFTLYREAFVARRSVDFFIRPSKQEKVIMIDAIEQDLSRFLPPQVMAVYRGDNYAAFLEAVHLLFSDIKTKGVRLP
jgi:hypothetical protein